jgi:hypothetical protein
MNIKLLMMITGAMVLSDVGFASTSSDRSAARKLDFGTGKRPPSVNVDASALPRPSSNYDLIEEEYRDEGEDKKRMITDPKKYGTGFHTNHYVYQARNDLINFFQDNITKLEEQESALADELKALKAEDAAYVRAVEIKKQALKDALLR